MKTGSWNKKRYTEYMEDIRIARDEIKNMKLYPSEPVVCDIYALPSHNFQAYYAMLYERNGRLEMVYAKPQIYSCLYTEPVRMYSFATSRESGKHPGFDGRIVMGIRHLTDGFSELIRSIMQNLPDRYILDENWIVIADGVFQALRVFDGDAVIKEAVYYEADRIPVENQKEWLINQLEHLYLLVGEIIGDDQEFYA